MLFDYDSLPEVEEKVVQRSAHYHFLTFGSSRFEGSARQLAAEVEALGGLFHEVHCFTELPPGIATDERWAEHLSRGSNRGHGWWFWKPALVGHLLQKGTLQDDDILVYGDAGCTVGPRSHHEWMLLFRHIMAEDDSEGADFVAFHHQHLENRYTKGDTFARFNVSWKDEDFGLTCQLVGGYWLARINARTRCVFRLWEQLAEDVSLISDDKSKLPNPCFRENRHDQSIFSMLMKSSVIAAERDSDTHLNAASNLHESEPTIFKHQVGRQHAEFTIPGLRAVVLKDVGWPVTGDPRQAIAAARRVCKGHCQWADVDAMEGCY
eukprot:TRINITY_DN17566_c0_g1_i1.p1 TRINITY_DN17566_c0_g1~~TRINITY_DN17566_c0_g1_i1.p1  ORF type:complete len:322 (+),score=69.02 TRINITY_DN17566_c0_g1_i1:59-1024(+)